MAKGMMRGTVGACFDMKLEQGAGFYPTKLDLYSSLLDVGQACLCLV
jgi:hypothetical protein